MGGNMRLRNKKTGVIIEPDRVAIIKNTKETSTASFNRIAANYYSLAELNEEWEDYKPTEPLIKDEKVRKAVRAWAEANELSGKLRVINEHFDCCKIIGRCDSRNVCLEIESKTTIAHANKDQFYTITELCGAEEE